MTIEILTENILGYMRTRTVPYDDWEEAVREALLLCVHDARSDLLKALSSVISTKHTEAFSAFNRRVLRDGLILGSGEVKIEVEDSGLVAHVTLTDPPRRRSRRVGLRSRSEIRMTEIIETDLDIVLRDPGERTR